MKVMRKNRSGLAVFQNMSETDRAEAHYWFVRTPAARLRELERLRQFNYGYGQGKPLSRFQRTLKISKLGKG
jgi:hypothetical protein